MTCAQNKFMKNQDRFDQNKLKFISYYEGKEVEVFGCQEIPENIQDYESIQIISLAMDFPSGYSLQKRKNLENRWINLLPSLDNIKTISIRHRVDSRYFEAICQMKNLKNLFFCTSIVDDIQSLRKLSKLETLVLDSFSRLKDISVLKSLKKIKRLSVLNSFNIKNYEIIGELEQLEALCLGGDTNAPRNLILDSLNPFIGLKNLKHLDLSDASIRDKSYEAILSLENLIRLDAKWRMPEKRRYSIKENHPNLSAGFFVDFDFVKNQFYEGKKWW